MLGVTLFCRVDEWPQDGFTLVAAERGGDGGVLARTAGQAARGKAAVAISVHYANFKSRRLLRRHAVRQFLDACGQLGQLSLARHQAHPRVCASARVSQRHAMPNSTRLPTSSGCAAMCAAT